MSPKKVAIFAAVGLIVLGLVIAMLVYSGGKKTGTGTK
jgi:hypothetical protein